MTESNNCASITHLQVELGNKIRFLSYGGCGLFTYFMVYELRKRGVPAVVKFFDYEDVMSKTIIYLNNRGNNRRRIWGLSAKHFYISTPYVDFDDYSIIPPESERYYNTGYYSLSRLRTAITRGSWNNMYDKTSNKQVYQIIRKHIEPIASYLKISYDNKNRTRS